MCGSLTGQRKTKVGAIKVDCRARGGESQTQGRLRARGDKGLTWPQEFVCIQHKQIRWVMRARHFDPLTSDSDEWGRLEPVPNSWLPPLTQEGECG